MRPQANLNSMKDQFMCHWDIVSIDPIGFGSQPGFEKESWNLDFGRPDVGYLMTVMHRCNP